MKKSVLILYLAFWIVLSSCTFRSYDVTFNYYVGNNTQAEITAFEKYKAEVALAEDKDGNQVINIPPNSGNLTIYIQAEVPKQFDIRAEAKLQTPLLGR
jgi:hypothetical protein